MQTDLYTGRQIEDFIVHERIGKGGMASVYRAFQPAVNRYVALKIISLDPELGERDEFRRRFTQEANLVASLEHIHILPIYDYGIVDNELAYLAMRLLRGGSLSLLLADGPLPLERAVEIFTQIARGLAYAHSRGVIHRDLKPSNILLDDAGNAYLTDFGLAKLIDNSLHLTKTGHIVGTPVYMSPEQLRGDSVDHRSDIYSLGVILYHMLVGKPPFDASDGNMVTVIYAHLEKSPPYPRDLNPDIPPAVEAIILRALEKDPANRYQTALEMANALHEALGMRVSTSSLPAAGDSGSRLREGQITHLSTETARRPVVSVSKQRGFNPIRITIGVALLAVAAVLAAVVIIQLTSSSQPAQRSLPTVLEGEVGSAEDSIPSQQEIDLALARLNNSFVVYATCNLTSEYHSAQAGEIRRFADRYGIDLRVYDSNSDPYTQITQINKAIVDGASAVIVCPLDAELLTEPLTSLDEIDMPLVLMSSDSDNYGGVLVASDDYEMGLASGIAGGEIAAEMFTGDLNVILLDYPDLPFLITRANGLEDGFRSVQPGANFIGRFRGGTADFAYESIRGQIENGINFNVILSINDAGAYGAIRALEEAGITPDQVLIASVDAEALARRYIREGYYIRASVELGRERYAAAAIDMVVRLLAGATVPEKILIPPIGAVTADSLLQLLPTDTPAPATPDS